MLIVMPVRNILIVDDDPCIRDILRSILDCFSLIHEAATYGDAMKLPPRSIDLAIIDYVLPDRDGFEVMQSLRECNPALPIILMTGHGDEDIAVRALRARVIDYMKKPLNLVYVKQRVSAILGTDAPRSDPSSHSDCDSHLEKAVGFIHSHYMEEISLAATARTAGMSVSSFCRAFKATFNLCFSSYLNRVRMQSAAQRLKKADVSITDIAFSVGFRHVGHFNRVFRATYKMSPREYRKRVTGEVKSAHD